jgi:hypothetical protein
MTIERITAFLHAPLVRPDSAERPRLPAPGETVLLTLEELPGDGVVATTAGGVSLRLTGLDVLNRELQPGDTLTMRVLANDPVLELQLYSPRPAVESEKAVPLTLSDYPAMRLDLAELRTIAWAAPSAAALAASWQVQAFERAGFPVYVWSGAQWGGMQMNLRVVDADEKSSHPAPRRRRAVQIELSHPSLGHIVIEVQWRLGGIQLTLAVEPAAAQAMRAALPSIVAALSRANLRLVRVRLTPEKFRLRGLRLGAPPIPQPEFAPNRIPATNHVLDANQGSDTNDPLDSRLFRAAAETAVTLLNPAIPRY